MLFSPDVETLRCSIYIVIYAWVGVTPFTIPLSGRLVLYTTHSETLLKVDFIANEACLANLTGCFNQIKKAEVDWARMRAERG